jgi:ectoine hydroxylase-related dioxygenase (phytanoyl-CoA dioxygenase family)
LWFEQWIRDGYFVVRDVVDPADLDGMTSVLDGLWESDAAVPGLVLLDLRESPDAPARQVPHNELLALPPDAGRECARRPTGASTASTITRRPPAGSSTPAACAALVSRLFGRRAHPFAAINFMTGSQQHLHQDMAVFHIYPHDFLVGAWIACEDVRADCGPLVIHPGSHRSGMFQGFTDYPQSNLRTADGATSAAYQRWVEDVAARHPPHEFLARKGDVLVWHGMLVHGGAPVLRRGTTRKSMSSTTRVRGADRTREVHGPFNW